MNQEKFDQSVKRLITSIKFDMVDYKLFKVIEKKVLEFAKDVCADSKIGISTKSDTVEYKKSDVDDNKLETLNKTFKEKGR